MTPKEKAKQLIIQFKKYAYYPKTKDDELFVKELNTNSKQCALIAVNEILDMLIGSFATIQYWEEVKQEIEKL